MKEEWKVYIRGVQDRGEEVIKALTDLGAEMEGHVQKKNPIIVFIILTMMGI